MGFIDQLSLYMQAKSGNEEHENLSSSAVPLESAFAIISKLSVIFCRVVQDSSKIHPLAPISMSLIFITSEI